METTINRNHLFPSLGPALMISMGYIDLGKWVAAVEAGSRFGSDLILPLLFFNLCAILCQYLATCISTATGKNLAEVLFFFPISMYIQKGRKLREQLHYSVLLIEQACCSNNLNFLCNVNLNFILPNSLLA